MLTEYYADDSAQLLYWDDTKLSSDPTLCAIEEGSRFFDDHGGY